MVFIGSPYDPGPHTFLEAQSFGAIVINGIKEGGARETFIEGKTGFNIAYKDSFALAEKILFILRNRDIALKMSLDAFENIQKNWKWEYVADRIAQAITDTWDK
ncbi:MAG: glycosyltransferase [Candidatus Coatesbacteria bacterium]|nr:glycosyltransferase [Candidatus Coatesbacteria bacterium]